MVETSVLVSALAGAGSFFSPCILPIIPAFVSYLSGTTLSELQHSQNPGSQSVTVKRSVRLNIFLNTVYFVLGFSFVFAVLVGATCFSAARCVDATTIYEAGLIGPTGVSIQQLYAQTVKGANVTDGVFSGVRFELTTPARVSAIGGHFAGTIDQSGIFGALVALAGPADFPDSPDLSTADVLATALLTVSTPSSEAVGAIDVALTPGWYALAFGSGLFGANGEAAAVLNGVDLGNPTYIGWSRNSVTEWYVLDQYFRNFRFVAYGEFIPEPHAKLLLLLAAGQLIGRHRRLPCRLGGAA